jgi:hypothetical protein
MILAPKRFEGFQMMKVEAPILVNNWLAVEQANDRRKQRGQAQGMKHKDARY